MLCNARILDNETFVKEVAGVTPWTAVEGFHVSRMWPDFLHVVDLAIAPESAASAAPAAVTASSHRIRSHRIHSRGPGSLLFDVI